MRSILSIAALATFLLGLTACAGVVAQSRPEGKITVHGDERHYISYVPSGYDKNTPIPLVLVLHPGLSNGERFLRVTGMDKTAEKNNFIAVFPDGSARFQGRGRYTWNAGSCCGYAAKKNVDDVGFLRKLVAELKTKYNIDPNRIYATGFSNGGGMAYRLACEASDMVKAIAVVSSSLDVNRCEMSKPVSVLHIHGTADKNNPYYGGYGQGGVAKVKKASTEDSLSTMRRLDHCAAAPQEIKRDDLHYYIYACEGESRVVHIKVLEGGHAWPGSIPLENSERFHQPTSKHLDTNLEVWNFFKQVSR